MPEVKIIGLALIVLISLLLVWQLNKHPKGTYHPSFDGKVVRCPHCGCLFGITKLG